MTDKKYPPVNLHHYVTREGKLRMEFGRPVEWLDFDQDGARNIAALLQGFANLNFERQGAPEAPQQPAPVFTLHAGGKDDDAAPDAPGDVACPKCHGGSTVATCRKCDGKGTVPQ